MQVIIISSCQDIRGYEEDDWDELIAAGPIQLMLNDTEMILSAKSGRPSWSNGYIRNLTEILRTVSNTNKRSLKELHEEAVARLIARPDYQHLKETEKQIPILMSTATKPIILTGGLQTPSDYGAVEHHSDEDED